MLIIKVIKKNSCDFFLKKLRSDHKHITYFELDPKSNGELLKRVKHRDDVTRTYLILYNKG